MASLLDDLCRFIRSHGVRVAVREMPLEIPGKFDGLTVAINPQHDQVSVSFYLAHAFGSIVQWSTAYETAKRTFDELRESKASQDEDRPRFEAALATWRRFEETSSEHAVWVLTHVGHERDVADYTTFFRADIEAMTVFHRTGDEPAWPSFFADWRRKVAAGEMHVEPFASRPVPLFTPRRIPTQEVLQEQE